MINPFPPNLFIQTHHILDFLLHLLDELRRIDGAHPATLREQEHIHAHSVGVGFDHIRFAVLTDDARGRNVIENSLHRLSRVFDANISGDSWEHKLNLVAQFSFIEIVLFG